MLREGAVGGEQALQDGRVRVALREELGGEERGIGAAGPDGGGTPRRMTAVSATEIMLARSIMTRRASAGGGGDIW